MSDFKTIDVKNIHNAEPFVIRYLTLISAFILVLLFIFIFYME